MAANTRCAFLIVSAGLTGAAAAEPVIAISKDGRTVVQVLPSETDNCGWTTETGVSLETTAGWTLNLRRQVGVVRVADLNGNGLPDLFVGCYQSSASPPYTDWYDMIFYNTGNPAAPFGAAPSWIASDQIHTGDAQLGDINGDGFLDVVAISGGFSFSPPRIYFGAAGGPSTSPGWLSTPPRAGWATGGLLFDVDNDGDLDLFTTNQGVSGAVPSDAWRAMYLHRNHDGVLETSPSWQSEEVSIQNTAAAIDYDGDGFLDVAVSKWVNFESGIYRNIGGNLETTMVWGVGTTGTDRGVAAGDVDGDGDTDLAFYIGSTGTRLYDNDGGVLTPVYTSNPPFRGAQEIALVDIDNDGDLDLVEVHFSDGRTHVYLNTSGVLSTAPDWTFDAPEVGNAIEIADVNGDGAPDLIVGYSGNISVRIFFGIPRVCRADLTGSSDPNDPAYGVPDGQIDIADFFYYLDQFVAGNLAVADLTGSSDPNDPAYGVPDGQIDIADFFYYLDLFVQGCP
ncbi:MAG: VCBS repeat-containing protein [Phycisphaeraceae bacterium]|nr:VCBS repeat-containing protein [Phycisphaeraceae bacterium]